MPDVPQDGRNQLTGDMMRIPRGRKLLKKSQKDVRNIVFISTSIRDSFDKAYKAAELSIKEELGKALEIDRALSEKLEPLTRDEDEPLSQEAIDIWGEQGENYWVIHENQDALLALSEMKMVFFYKTVEIAIKEMMTIAFPKVNKNDLYRWDFVKAYLKSNDIDVKSIEGYLETNGLRIVNNNIKHSTELYEETKKIPFWKNKTEFTADDLDSYYNLVDAKVREFMDGLGRAIVSALYEFNEEKLESMARDIADKLSTEQAEKLIEKIKLNIR